MTAKVDLLSAQELFSQRGLEFQPVVEEVSVFSTDGTQVDVGGPGDSFSFNLPPDGPYLVKATTVDGAVLWALTPVLDGDTIQDISLETTYQAGLIYAAEGGDEISGRSVEELKMQARSALDIGADRLVNTVNRVVRNALLWRVDYSIVNEVNEVNLRAFGGGLSPVRSLESILDEPQPDYVPHIYMLNTAAGDLFLDRILMSEMKADRWAAIKRGYALDAGRRYVDGVTRSMNEGSSHSRENPVLAVTRGPRVNVRDSYSDRNDRSWLRFQSPRIQNRRDSGG